MNINELFINLHGILDKSKLIPLYTLIEKDKSKLNGLPTKKQFNEIIKYLGINKENIFYDPNSLINQIIYLHRYVYLSIQPFSVDFLKQTNFAECLKRQEKTFEQLEKEKNYNDIFMFMEKKLLIPTYIEIFDQIPDAQKYEIFVDVHIRSENGFELFTKEMLQKIFSYRYLSPEYPKRIQRLKRRIRNKKQFTIYHGHNQNYDPKDEYSWTLNRKVALFFANRFNNTGVISKKIITMNEVIDFYDNRNEDEIILLTENLK